jgi:hypothetical protein
LGGVVKKKDSNKNFPLGRLKGERRERRERVGKALSNETVRLSLENGKRRGKTK